MNFPDILATIALIIAFLAIWLLVPGWMVKRNIPKVIKIFRKKDAIGIRNAKAPAELGLQPKSFYQRLFSRRDYKPKALELLMQLNVVFATEDGKLYITEESISAPWLKLKK